MFKTLLLAVCLAPLFNLNHARPEANTRELTSPHKQR